MSQDDKNKKNIVRDRTLVLRILVPGLHTCLNDKINAKKEEDPVLSSSAAASSGRISADQLWNLDGVTCLPSSEGSTLWRFRCDGATYPARLVNLPCPVEVHKTHDHANYIKAADIGQMLIVYEDDVAMKEAEDETKGYHIDGFPSYYHSGLTPPMQKVVQRRFLSRFEERDTKPIPPPKSVVSKVEEEMQELMAKLKVNTGKGRQKKTSGTSSSISAGKNKVIEEVEEEIVDYEPWMGEGGVFTIDDAKLHPEWFLSKDEIKEIEDAKAAVEEEKRQKEREAQEKAERKKKKKEKKQKDKEDAKKSNIASTLPKGQEIDDITAAAMAVHEGMGDEDFLLGGDDMFDFDNDDITDLLG